MRNLDKRPILDGVEPNYRAQPEMTFTMEEHEEPMASDKEQTA